LKWNALLSYITILCLLDPPPVPTVHCTVCRLFLSEGRFQQETLNVAPLGSPIETVFTYPCILHADLGPKLHNDFSFILCFPELNDSYDFLTLYYYYFNSSQLQDVVHPRVA